MTFVTVFNTTDRPVLLDGDGREVGGRDWGTADTLEEQAKAALASGSLTRADVPDGDGVNPAATAAAARTARLSERRDTLTGLAPDRLTELGATAGLSPDLNKTELVRALAFREDVAVPAAKEK